jgi:hypothetical protein
MLGLRPISSFPFPKNLFLAQPGQSVQRPYCYRIRMLKSRTGGESVFADRMLDPEYQAPYQDTSTQIRSVDAAARALNSESEVHGTE